mmetsp:Transcript_2701/g.4069  ORF Transcript_2701/g.4069 Transcript_2701/m.4069 type:complete len:284 (+) Transcript_2701:458-1309(+)
MSLVHVNLFPQDATVGEMAGYDLVLAWFQLHEAVLIIPAVYVWLFFGRDATSSTRDYNSCVPEHVRATLLPQALQVNMASYDDINTKSQCQVLPVISTPHRREVCNNDLPFYAVTVGLGELFLDPMHLVVPYLDEPPLALPDIEGAGLSATLVLRILRHAANVMARNCIWIEGIEHIGVHEEVIYLEVIVDCLGLVVQSWLKPSPRRAWPTPGVSDVLIPSRKVIPATIVVVTEHAKPLLVFQTLPIIHPFVDVLPLSLRDWGSEVLATRRLQTSPVEIIADV